MSFAKSFDQPIVVLRPFNHYGPRQSARAVIPTVISQIASGLDRIQLGAISPTRDFTHVLDTATGFIQAMQCEEAEGKVVNIGSNFEISIGEVVKAISDIMGRPVSINQQLERFRPKNSEVDRRC